MTRAPAIKYERGPCPQCGAETDTQAETMCKQTCDQTGEWSCAGEFDRNGHSIRPTAASVANLDAWIDRHMAALDAREKPKV